MELGLTNSWHVVGFEQSSVVSAEFINGTIEIVRRVSSNAMYTCNPPKPVPDKIWKEIYGVKDGVIQLLERIDGKYTPSYVVNETITFG